MKMNSEPDILFLKRKDIVDWFGITDNQFKYLRELGAFKPIWIGNKKTTLYSKDEIKQDFNIE